MNAFYFVHLEIFRHLTHLGIFQLNVEADEFQHIGWCMFIEHTMRHGLYTRHQVDAWFFWHFCACCYANLRKNCIGWAVCTQGKMGKL